MSSLSVDYTLLMNIASACFFTSEVIKIYRRWRGKDMMQSTSFIGSFLHVIGNGTSVAVSYILGAWVAVFAESFLSIIGVVSMYWKWRWLKKEHINSRLDLFMSVHELTHGASKLERDDDLTLKDVDEAARKVREYFDVANVDAFMRMKKPMKVYYFSYGYTRDPKEATRDVQLLVQEILAVRDDITPVVPHFIFAALLGFPKGYSQPRMLCWEVEIISRCDGLVYDPKMFKDSRGVKWEVAIARHLKIPIYTYDEVLKGRDLE